MSFVTASPSHAWRNVDTSARTSTKESANPPNHDTKQNRKLSPESAETARTDDLGGRALVAEPAAAAAPTAEAAATAAEPAPAAATAAAAAEAAASAAPSRWPHGACGAALGLARGELGGWEREEVGGIWRRGKGEAARVY